MSQKHILISGATGFLGSYLTHAFVARGDEVTILKRNTSNTERIADILSAVRSVNTDVDPVELAFENYSAYDVVINTVGIYGRRGESAAAILQSNLCFAVELLQLSSKYNAKKFINTNTSADSMLNDYALAKRQFSDWGRLYTRQSDMAIYDILLEHMYGPGDDTKKFIEFIIEKCEAQGLATPQYKPDSAIFHTIIWRKTAEAEEGEARPTSPMGGVGDKSGTSQGQVEGTSQGQGMSLFERITSILADQVLSSGDITAALGKEYYSGHLRRVIKMLLSDGIIEYTIPEKPRSRLQKYRLTEKGRQMLAQKGVHK